jgi:leucyl-tRNA synthetase
MSDDEAAAGFPPLRYGPKLAGDIEERWQRRWARDGTFDSPNPAGSLSAGFADLAGKPKYYVLDMFPYPSGTGLHVGHPLGYIATDVYARYLRMTGYHVLHTFGYDAFGLPAEQFAIDTGQHPSATARANIDTMRAQLRRLGLGHDQRREIATTDPGYYRWTQWIFLRIFGSWCDERTGRARPISELVSEFESGERGTPDGRPWAELTEPERRVLVDGHRLAYISHEPVNWCPGLGTVLANEEVTAEGRSDVGNFPVIRRPLRQWMLRITAFADRLAADLDLVDWPESLKQMQRNWIGAGDGAQITFRQVKDRAERRPDAGQDAAAIEVFTTRPDTLAGATFLVLAPEHPAVDRLVAAAWPAGVPDAWQVAGGQDTSAERTNGLRDVTPRQAVARYRARAGRLSDRQRTGHGGGRTGVFTGAFVRNPATGGPLPVFVADYVLVGHGTGAIMGVPAHDQRDLDFARLFCLPITRVLEPGAAWLAEHGLDPGAPAEQWPAAFTGDGSYAPAAAGPELAGLPVSDAIAATIGWLAATGHGRAATSYRLRDWLFSRQRYWGEPFPVVYDEAGLPIGLPDEMLPVLLPEMTDFRPEPAGAPEPDAGQTAGQDAEPVPPLGRAAGWASVELDLGAGRKRYRRELNTMPQWAGSCWYYLRYLDPGNDQAIVDPAIERYWMTAAGPATAGDGGVDLYVGGVEHAVLHLLYARFWHKVLYDLGYVSTAEPFRRLVNQGYILADAFTDERGRYVPAAQVSENGDGTPVYQGGPVTRRAGKMGKSLKNGVSPDDIYQRYGADTLRLYEMSMGPLESSRPWQADDIPGAHRFLQRLWRAIVDEQTGQAHLSERPLDEQTLRRLHQTIKKVRQDCSQLRFNTAIARLIELTAIAAKVAARDGALPRTLAEPLVLMVAPLAPHVAEELWQRIGHDGSLAYEPFPVADERLAAELTARLPVQVNGKTRFTFEAPADASERQIEYLLRAQPDFARHTDGMPIERLVIVPGRIVSIVVRQSRPAAPEAR